MKPNSISALLSRSQAVHSRWREESQNVGLQSIPPCSFSPEDKCSVPSTVCVQLCPAENLSLLFPMGDSSTARESYVRKVLLGTG